MSDMHLRNKLRRITEAAKDSDSIPERSKSIGMLIFYFFIAIGMLGLFALIISFLIYGHWIGASTSCLITLFLIYPLYKLLSAENIDFK